jgi:hypothetical protein
MPIIDPDSGSAIVAGYEQLAEIADTAEQGAAQGKAAEDQLSKR